MSKSPSQCDGKPIGTPTDAKLPWQAGVTFGPDQVERDAEARRLRNRASKKAAKERLWAARAARTEDDNRAFKQRRNRADQMTRALRNGTPIPNVANHYGVKPDDVLAEVKWLSSLRNRHRARHRSADAKAYPVLPPRDL